MPRRVCASGSVPVCHPFARAVAEGCCGLIQARSDLEVEDEDAGKGGVADKGHDGEFDKERWPIVALAPVL